MSSPDESAPDEHTQAMIGLRELTKRYRGQPTAAVDRITMDIPAGEIVVFVGPSGCGKTTTLKMINRLIEPSSGQILLGGEDVTAVDPDRLRRRIGYVIQQIGLFPHLTIAANIGMVPKLLKWDRHRIADRVDELLHLVGMEPAEYRDRYPKELSGGQRQRVGVARAMGADPAVMLMDEPFGAIDPITRHRLQTEFLRLQAEIQKTVIFVTHDIDEAILMGDRIAILRQNAHIAQYDTPETILTRPADEFVKDFIGSGASLKRLRLTEVGDIEPSQVAVADRTDDAQQQRWLADTDDRYLLLLDEQRRPDRWIDRLAAEHLSGSDATVPVTARVSADDTIYDAMDEILTSRVGSAVVVDRQGAYGGVIDTETIMGAIQAMAGASHGGDSPDRGRAE